MDLHRCELAVEVCCEGVKGYLDERVHDEVVGYGIDFDTGHKVCLAGAWSEGGDVAYARVDVPDHPVDRFWFELGNGDGSACCFLGEAGWGERLASDD